MPISSSGSENRWMKPGKILLSVISTIHNHCKICYEDTTLSTVAITAACSNMERPRATLQPYFLAAILCRIDESAVVGLQVGYIETGIVQFMPLNKHSLQNFLERQENFQGQINASIESWPDLELAPAKSPLKLKLGLRRGSINSNIGGNHCQNVLLSKNLIAKHQVQQVLGTESTNFIRNIIFQRKGLQRANRTLHVDWRQDGKSWFAHTELSEGVFGNPIYQGYHGNSPSPLAMTSPFPNRLKSCSNWKLLRSILIPAPE